MASLFRTLSQRFRRSKRHRHPGAGGGGAGGGGGTSAGTSEYQQGFDQPEMDPRKHCQCKVMLLDGTDMTVVVSKNANGQELYEQVFYTLDLEERDYFGLQFMDHYHVQHWLDPVKRISKQVPIGPPYTFRFRVKFYSSEPNNLREELTRYQFFLQLKQDIQSGRLECPKDLAIELAALALQSELGDYNPAEHTPALISEFRFHPEQDEEMEIAILEKFTTCRGQSPAVAEMNYLNKAKWIELYGVDMHTVEGKDGNLYKLGLTPSGMLVFDGNQKIGLFLWEKIQKLDFKNRKITLVVEEDADQASGHVQLHTFVFNLSSHKACKHLWKCAIEHHTFFRLKYHRPRVAKTSQLFRLGSTFRYRGRTEYENVHKDGGRLSRRQSATFERRPSQRYGPRQSLVNRRIQIRNDFKQQVGASAGLPLPTDPVAPMDKPHPAADVDNKHQLLLNGNGFDTTKPMVNGYANSSRTSTPPVNKVSAIQNTVHEGQINGIKELDQSPSAARRPFNAGKEPSSQWPGAPVVPGTPPTTTTGHVTTIAISSNGTQIHTPTSPSRIPRHNGTPIITSPPNNNNGGSITIPTSQQPFLPRSFPENGYGTKSSGGSVSSASGSAVSSPRPQPMHQATSPSKSSIGSASIVRSPVSSPAHTPLNQTFTISPEKAFQNSTVIGEPSTVIHVPTTVSNGGQSFIRSPPATNGHHPPISAIPVATVPTTVPTSAATVTRTDTFTISDRKPFGQAEYFIKPDERSSGTVSGSHHFSESHSRIPHLRGAAKSTGIAAGKTGTALPSGSFTPTTTQQQFIERSVESTGMSGDRSQRSRLPIRSGRAGTSSSSMTTATGIPETPGPRTSSYDEKISQSRIPVMASSVHRPQPQIQSVGQM